MQFSLSSETGTHVTYWNCWTYKLLVKILCKLSLKICTKFRTTKSPRSRSICWPFGCPKNSSHSPLSDRPTYKRKANQSARIVSGSSDLIARALERFVELSWDRTRQTRQTVSATNDFAKRLHRPNVTANLVRLFTWAQINRNVYRCTDCL